jgi:hypothetical protein
MGEAKGFFDKAKAAAEQAAGKAKEEVAELQTRRELGQAQKDLGMLAFELIEVGELDHPALAEPAARIRELSARLADGGEPEEAETSEPAGP